MANEKKPLGSVGWLDLTVSDASALRDFYASVVGWEPVPLSMGDYDDYCMNDPGGETRAGVCHKRGANADIPSVWLVYFMVADLDRSLAECRERGGKVLSGPRGEGDRFAIVQDPAGAVCALYQQA